MVLFCSESWQTSARESDLAHCQFWSFTVLVVGRNQEKSDSLWQVEMIGDVSVRDWDVAAPLCLHVTPGCFAAVAKGEHCDRHPHPAWKA